MLTRWFSFASIIFLLGSPTNSGQKDLFNYGLEWKAWSDVSRSIYLDGFVDGQSNTYLAVLNDLPQERREPLRLQTFTFYDRDSIRDVMTNLYADPANTYITHNAIVYIARDKLSGKDVEPILRIARQQDRGYVKQSR